MSHSRAFLSGVMAWLILEARAASTECVLLLVKPSG